MRAGQRGSAKHEALNIRIEPPVRKLFTLGHKAYGQLLARLNAAPRPNRRLLKSMRTPAPWE